MSKQIKIITGMICMAGKRQVGSVMCWCRKQVEDLHGLLIKTWSGILVCRDWLELVGVGFFWINAEKLWENWVM